MDVLPPTATTEATSAFGGGVSVARDAGGTATPGKDDSQVLPSGVKALDEFCVTSTEGVKCDEGSEGGHTEGVNGDEGSEGGHTEGVKGDKGSEGGHAEGVKGDEGLE